jgi:hypothetical protein
VAPIDAHTIVSAIDAAQTRIGMMSFVTAIINGLRIVVTILHSTPTLLNRIAGRKNQLAPSTARGDAEEFAVLSGVSARKRRFLSASLHKT